MILSMMSRVSLGHTGRMLLPKAIMGVAFWLLFLMAVTRALLPALGLSHFAWQVSALGWIIAFAIFVWVYFPVLIAPRQDSFR